MADKIVLMKDGHIEQVGTPDELYDRPASQYAADFIGSPSMNFVEAEVVSENGAPLLVTEGVRLALSNGAAGIVDRTVTCGLRPSDLMLSESGEIAGEVILAEKTGADQNLHLSIGSEDFVATAPRDAVVRAGDVARLSIAPDKVHLFDLETGRRL